MNEPRTILASDLAEALGWTNHHLRKQLRSKLPKEFYHQHYIPLSVLETHFPHLLRMYYEYRS